MQECNFPVAFVVIDDASKDGEPELLRSWAEARLSARSGSSLWQEIPYGSVAEGTLTEHSNLTFAIILLNENHYSKRKSKMAYMSKWCEDSKYTAICEGDDYWTDPHKLQKQVDFMEAHNDYSLCFTDVKNYNQTDGKYVGSHVGKYDNNKLPADKKDLFFYILMGKCRIQTLTALYRNEHKALIPKNSQTFMMGDTPLWLDLSQVGKLGYISDVTGVYRITPGSACRNPKTLLRFRLSMQEMRVYYCQKYNYEIPEEIKRRYNIALVDSVINSDFKDSMASCPLFPMNKIQLFFYKKAPNNRFAKQIIHFMWRVEYRIHRS